MSCGRPHETSCTEVLAFVHEFVDGEVTEVRRLQIVQHLDECPPCGDEFGLVSVVKSLVYRSCASEAAPERLRVEIVTRIRQISVTYRSTESGE